MTILLTGFEPFGRSREHGLNPSQRVVEALVSDPPAGIDLHTAILPVAFETGGSQLRRLIDEHDPSAILLLGQGGGSALRFERVGINLEDIPGRQDNTGQTREEHPIDPDGPAAYFATIPVRDLVRHLNAAGIPAIESFTAGAFLCNHVLYTARRYCDLTHRTTPVGFIHLPLLPEQAAAEPGRDRPPSMALDTQVYGIRLTLSLLAGQR